VITRRDFIKKISSVAGYTVFLNPFGDYIGKNKKSKVVSTACDDVLTGSEYNPDAVHKMFETGLKELTGKNSIKNAWASLFGPEDIVGIKINGVGAPKISSSLATINETIAGLKSAGVKENNIIVWEHVDMSLKRAGLKINKSTNGVRVKGTSDEFGTLVTWVKGYDKNVYYTSEAGTLRKFKKLMNQNFLEKSSYREIVNSMTWIYLLINQGNKTAEKYSKDIRELLFGNQNLDKLKNIAQKVMTDFANTEIENEEKSYFSSIVTQDITKLINLCVLKHNTDSGVTFALKNIALGVTTNKVRFHSDFCTRSIPEINSFPCIKDKLVLNIGEAAKISLQNAVGRRITKDNRIFFSFDPVAVDRIGLDILENKRREAGLHSVRHEATHISASAKKGLGTDNLNNIEFIEFKV